MLNKIFGKRALCMILTLCMLTGIIPLCPVAAASTPSIVSGSAKTRRSFYTDRKVAIARENIEKYTWAKEERDNAVNEADKYAGKEELLWNVVTTQELPRSMQVGARYDPEYRQCPNCNTDIYKKYGSNPWIIDVFNDPWKIKCPECNNRFPSNDFESFYKSGIDEHGNWNYERSKQNGQQYLKNVLYPEKGEKWCVDDGYGYISGRKFSDGFDECKTFISYYNETGLWYATYRYNTSGLLIRAIDSLSKAYIYTGDAKYGRTGAILLDRIADLYPDMDLTPYSKFPNACGGTMRGKVLGKIADYNLGLALGGDYDALWPAMEDPYVVDFLSQKAAKYNMDNPKNTPQMIRMNCENGLLREINRAVRDCRINSNFGHHQSVLSLAAVALDTMPETKEWIDWVFQSGGAKAPWREVTGGNVYAQLVDLVDRDGHGNEAAPAYNAGWMSSILMMADILAGYDKYASADLYKHPKVQRMLKALTELGCSSRYTPSIGDSGQFGAPLLLSQQSVLVRAWNSGIRDANIARQLYALNGEKVAGIHGDIFTKDPEKIQEDISKIVNANPGMQLGSSNLAGYGLMLLRDGTWIKDLTAEKTIDTQRDFWMYYGYNFGHGHYDKLNLGVHSYGIDMAPDLGSPVLKSIDANRLQWVTQTLSHNTVVVNEGIKNPNAITNADVQNISKVSTPLHFDDAGRVKVMDVDAPELYDATDIYRRTFVMVEASDDVSYGVDFFRIRGGNDHIYSFHAQSDEVSTEGVTLAAQEGGTYAGADVSWGPDPLTDATSWVSPLKYAPGYTWIYNIQKAREPKSPVISADFKIKDYYNVLPTNADLHLRLTMLNDSTRNDSTLSEFTIGSTQPPQFKGAPTEIKQVIARRSGKNLDTLYTSVIEPYKGSRYISSVEGVPIEKVSGLPSKLDKVQAVKVTYTNGREDFIVYATNNKTLYRIDGKFYFRGFIGVYCIKNGKIVCTYINDGDIIGEKKEILPNVTGKIIDFTKELTTNNTITVALDKKVDTEQLVNRHIYVDNGGMAKSGEEYNGCFKIESVEPDGANVKLKLSNTTLIRSYADSKNIKGGYQYYVAEGQSIKIPLSYISKDEPVFTMSKNYTVAAESKLRFKVQAKSPLGLPLTYKEVILPTGAVYDSKTQIFSWVPDYRQKGPNAIAFRVSDGVRETEIKGCIEVTAANNQDSSENITRADFIILLVRALKLASNYTDNFADVPKNAYYANELSIAKGYGIVTGVGNNCFNPTVTINRQDMIVIIARALEKAGYVLKEEEEAALAKFADAAQISHYAKHAAALLAETGIIVGDGGKINPKEYATRAEATALIYRILNNNVK